MILLVLLMKRSSEAFKIGLGGIAYSAGTYCIVCL